MATVSKHSGNTNRDGHSEPWTSGGYIHRYGGLPLPATVRRKQVLWLYVAAFATIHVLALLAFVPWLFSWTGLAICLLGIHFVGHGITLCYHRLLTHRSFRTPKWVERLLVVNAMFNMEDTPAKWVAWHRMHHLFSDEQQDPHSPLVNWFWGHMGWLTIHNVGTHDISAYHKYARDILQDPFYLALEKNRWLSVAIYAGHAAILTAIGYGLGLGLWGRHAAGVQLAASVLVWGVFVRTVAVWHITWSVNSLTHLFGYRSYETADNSRNNWFVALLTVGEGWHNNHHHDEASASNQHRWWEFDVVYYEIRLLEMLGLASHVVRPRFERHAERTSPAPDQPVVEPPPADGKKAA